MSGKICNQMLTMFLFVAGVRGIVVEKYLGKTLKAPNFLPPIFFSDCISGPEISLYKDCLYRLLYVKMLVIYCDSQNIEIIYNTNLAL